MLRLHGAPGAASSHPADVLGAAVGGGDALGGDALEVEQPGISSISARRSILAKSGRERSRHPRLAVLILGSIGILS
jgi:hypothetical protein